MDSNTITPTLLNPLIWLDLELTGLNDKKDQIIEIAIIVTDGKLIHTYEGPCLIINCPDKLLDEMDDWCTKTHTESGLVDRVKQSKTTLKQAETEVLNFIKSLGIKEKEGILAGNSIHMDKIFLMKDMPDLIKYLHYRIFDVTSLKIMCENFYPETYNLKPKKKLCHRALDDIKESIEEFKYYFKYIFIASEK